MWCFSCGAAPSVKELVIVLLLVSLEAKQQDSADENPAYSLLGPIACLDKPYQKRLSSVKLL